MQQPYLNNFGAIQQALPSQFTLDTDILVFKTNIKTQREKFFIGKMLIKHPYIKEWNVDMDDIDCVLRIVSAKLAHRDIIEMVNRSGFYCEELL